MNLLWDADVPYIKLLGVEHYFYFACIVFLIVFVLINRYTLRKHRKIIGITILLFSITQQILLYGWYWIIMDFNLAQALPLHLCRISTLLGIAYLLTKNRTIMDFVFYYGLFTYFSFLLPFSIYPPNHIMGISYLINHAITLILPIIAWYAWGWRPKSRNIPSVVIGFITYFFIVVWVNKAVQGNYFYLVTRPLLQNLPDLVYNSLALVVTIFGFLLAYWIISISNPKKVFNQSIAHFKLNRSNKYFIKFRSNSKRLASS